ncbi:alpha/beta-hydrolase [Thelephora terrestris]|uniref:sn-1-specific diacylglycerol lipase n=1 Tax=Thelephora terrestris TaxID=56493 RepID=A0A9P6H9Q5_9AGAM|nr:alpha/beta-hydrolase [Thelephora terrestris]
MSLNFERISRAGLDAASIATSLGFTAAKLSTRLGFSITRGITATAAGITGSVLDYGLFGGRTSTGPVLSNAVASTLSVIEQITLAPILISESLTSTSFTAAIGSLDLIPAIMPGGDEATFSLGSFIQLVRREWTDPVGKHFLPEKRYSVLQVAKAVAAWATLQGLTHKWQEKRWSPYLRQIHLHKPPHSDANPLQPSVYGTPALRVTADVIFPGSKGQIISADIGEAVEGEPRDPHADHQASNLELYLVFRRLSKLVLAGYGGASLLFFGLSQNAFVSPGPSAGGDANLAEAVEASERQPSPSPPNVAHYSWWNLLLGRHDHDIFHNHARSSLDTHFDAITGAEPQMPRYWVLSDHRRKQVVLVIRGTVSLSDLAVDLTCEPEEMGLDHGAQAGSPPLSPFPGDEDDSFIDIKDILESIPGSYPGFLDNNAVCGLPPSASHLSISGDSYQVHGGIQKMAMEMGSVGRPVWLVVNDALKRNPSYELILCGHSLGAGLCTMLGLMWADPGTCVTVCKGGLPPGHRVQVYALAPPCILDSKLSKLSSSLVHSFVYSNDVVSRLSLGSVRDMTSAASWLCDADERGKGEGYTGILRRALMQKAGYGDSGSLDWFLSIRRTLEANMQMDRLYPPGRVLWAVSDNPNTPTHSQATSIGESCDVIGNVRLYEVLDVEKVFGQVVFARDMLSSHMPHMYDRVLQQLCP